LRVAIVGRNGIPTAGVDAVSLNVTAVVPNANGFLSVFPSGASVPNSSSLNFVGGQVTSNAVITKVGDDGFISIFNAAGSTDVLVDIAGWYSTSDGITALTPLRILDSRPGFSTFDGQLAGFGAAGPGRVIRIPVLGRAGIPASGVGAVSLNVTAVSPTSDGFLSVYPSGYPRPSSSNINFKRGQTIPNAVIAKVGTDGTVSIYNPLGSTNIIVDINGWFPVAY
jgi:hypothetical protein